jgi:hypothetical protein
VLPVIAEAQTLLPRTGRRPVASAVTREAEITFAEPPVAEGSLASLAALALSGGPVRPASPIGDMTSPFEAALRAVPSDYDDGPEFGVVHQFPMTEDQEVDDAALSYAVGDAGDPAPAPFLIPERDEAEALRGRRARRQAAAVQGEHMIPVNAAPISRSAARAVDAADSAGASGGADDQDRDAESINRGLLLKFLSSVRS